jgi:hypothetical protein
MQVGQYSCSPTLESVAQCSSAPDMDTCRPALRANLLGACTVATLDGRLSPAEVHSITLVFLWSLQFDDQRCLSMTLSTMPLLIINCCNIVITVCNIVGPMNCELFYYIHRAARSYASVSK